MAQGIGVIIEIRLEGGETSGRSASILIPPGLKPAPGQYLMAASPDLYEPLPAPLFPAFYRDGGEEGIVMGAAGPLPHSWYAGMELRLRGPLGRGFHLPPTARRVALAAFDPSPARLMALAHLALAQRCAVALYTRTTPPMLPAEVEVLPLDLLSETTSWADYMALDLTISDIRAARQMLGIGLYGRTPFTAQALVRAAMPCGGAAECGACAVLTRDGWRLACSDGPVFDFNALEDS